MSGGPSRRAGAGARLYPNGTLESFITFDTMFGANGTVAALAIRPDGSVIAGGDFTDYNGTPRGRLALLANQPAADELVIADGQKDAAIGAIVKAAKTGKIGDGKVFVSAIEEAVRIRTEEKGDSAI